jgi:hypothetical protein
VREREREREEEEGRGKESLDSERWRRGGVERRVRGTECRRP